MIRIYVDTNILITAFEGETKASRFVWHVLEAAEHQSIAIATSQITLAEVLPKPLSKGQPDLVEAYENIFAGTGTFEVLPITLEVLRLAARIRTDRSSIKLPDAIHLATAHIGACSGIFSDDRRLALPSGLLVIPTGPDSLGRIRALSP